MENYIIWKSVRGEEIKYNLYYGNYKKIQDYILYWK